MFLCLLAWTPELLELFSGPLPEAAMETTRSEVVHLLASACWSEGANNSSRDETPDMLSTMSHGCTLSDWHERDQQWPLKSLCWLTSQSYRAWLAVTFWHNKHWQELSVSLFCLSLIHFQTEQLSFLPVALGILICKGCFEYVIDSVLSVPRRKTCFHSDALLPSAVLLLARSDSFC